MKYRVRPAIDWLSPVSYLGEEGADNTGVIDCSLGVNPYGFSPTITKDIFASVYDELGGYPPHPYTAACKAVAEYFSDIAPTLTPAQISMQSGSMSALRTLNFIFLEPNTKILAPSPCFSSYLTDVYASGAGVDFVPMTADNWYSFDPDAFIAALRPEHRLAYIDRPNNPTGQAVSLEDLRRILDDAQKKEVVVIVDEAYGDFLEKEDSAVSLIDEYDNLVMVRTFSKGFGLGAIRAGYIVMPKPMVSVVSRAAGEMNLTTTAARLVPYALKDPAFVAESRDKVAAEKTKLLSRFRPEGNTVMKVAVTCAAVPISMFYTKDPSIDLCGLFEEHKIRVEKGSDFYGLGKNFVRVRVPQNADELLSRMEEIEAALEG